MKRLMGIVATVLLLAMYPAVAADTKTSPASTGQKSQAKPEKKAPGTMEKTGNSLESGWHKFTKSVKQGSKEPPCKQEQKSLKHCD